MTFEATIEVKSCPKDRSQWNQTIQIYPVGISELLVVHLEMICECDCEKPWNEVRPAKLAVCTEGKAPDDAEHVLFHWHQYTPVQLAAKS